MTVRSVLSFGSAALLVAGLGLSSPAQAASLTAVQIINTYNLVVFGDLTSSSEVDGRAFVSGNLQGSGSNYAIHDSQLTPSTAPALTVGGSVMTSVNVNGKGVQVGGNVGATDAKNVFHAGSITANAGGDVVVKGNVNNSSINGNFNGNGNAYVKGSIQNNSHVTANSGSVYVGGTVDGTSSATANGGGALHQNSPVPGTKTADIAGQTTEMKTTLTNYSTYLKSLTKATGNVVVASGTATFNATLNPAGMSIINITNPDSVLTQGQFSFNIDPKTQAIFINVSGIIGDSLTIGANFLGGIAQTLGKNTIWNFTDAGKTININAQFGGTILALNDIVNVNANVEGSVLAAVVNQKAEIHYDGQGLIPAPVPAALPLFAAAIGGMAGFRKLRGRKASAATRAA